MNTQVTTPNKKSTLPAHLQNAAVDAISEFSAGVKSGFPVLSIRGRVWRIKIAGEEQVHEDENGDAVPSIEVVLLRSNPQLSKILYAQKYEEGSDAKPDCYSADSLHPSPDVEKPVSKSCVTCPKNQWGSRITESGKKSRACADVRRVALVFASDLERAKEDPKFVIQPMLLRMPAASLTPLKDYAAKTLGPKGIQPYMLVTRLGFDNTAEYPKLTFKPARFLDEEEFNTVMGLREGDEAAAILQQVAEYSTADGTTEDDEPAGSDSVPLVDEVTTAPSASKKAKPKAAKKRDASPAEAEAEAVANAKTAVPDDDEDETAPAVVEEDDEGDEAVDDFDKMLANILGD